MIKVENLVKSYGNHVAVDDLSFTVEKGQVYGFLGPNGAGKSTTMNIMTGYLAATSGRVEIHGYDILTQPEEAKRCIGYLPEVPPLYQDMTVMEYLLFAAELKKVAKKERKEQIQEILQMVELKDVENRLIRNLSKGYRQRVGLAQAIIGYPDVIILDEPMVGMDPKEIIEIRALIKKLAQKHTIILSSHILSEVSTVCDHIMIISHGKLVASDSPEGLQKRMETSVEIELTAMGGKKTASRILDKLGNVQSYEIENASEEDSVKIRVQAKDNKDIRKELSMAFAKGEMPILSMNRVEHTLEDIFLQLTEDAKEDIGMTDADSEDIDTVAANAEDMDVTAGGKDTNTENIDVADNIIEDNKTTTGGQEEAKDDSDL